MNEKIYTQEFVEGVNSDFASERLPKNAVRAMKNIDIFSSNGEQYVATNVRGNVKIPIDLPEGENRCISRPILDEEANNMYFLVWNSNGNHTFYQYDYTTNSITVLFRNLTDTGNVNLMDLKSSDFVAHADIVNNNLLYWALKGHPAGKFNLTKMRDKSDEGAGYGPLISESMIRAYKRTAEFPPIAEYATDSTRKFNNVYGYLFKFAVRWIYDDGEKSHFSDFSKVAIPSYESTTGVKGVPLDNNVILVSFACGDSTVKKVELVMQKTDSINGGVMNWMSIGVFDKAIEGIEDGSSFTYRFFNDVTYLSIDQNEVNLPYSALPINPECQVFADNTIIYSNYLDGFDSINVDVDVDVDYEELYIDSSSTPVENNPTITFNRLDINWEKSSWLGGAGYRLTTEEIIIGADVKRGNKYRVDMFYPRTAGSTFGTDVSVIVESKIAGLEDNATTMASDLAAKFAAMHYTDGKYGSYVSAVETDSLGNAKFTLKVCNDKGKWYFDFRGEAFPVEYSKLVDSGTSVLNRKLGSSWRGYIVYEDDDGRKSLGYTVGKQITVKSLNELGKYKAPIVTYLIKNRPPEWASSYQIYETKNLVHQDFIQILIQNKIKSTETNTGLIYHDLIIGSLHTYQEIHPNNTLKYEFKKGDRVRLLMEYDDANTDKWSVPTDVLEYEVVDYLPTITSDVNKNIKINGTNQVQTDLPDSNNIGSYLSVNGYMRLITGINSTGYDLDAPIIVENATDYTYPSYQIVNNRGVLRIRENEDYPIIANGINKFALIEVYKPYRDFVNDENVISYAIGEKWDIVTVGGTKYHQGNIQDQTDLLPAKIRTGGINNYVRNREFPVNNSVKNPQMIMNQIEDMSYSDFYYSNLASYGRPTVEDNKLGRVHLGSSNVHSNNFIAGSQVNGLSMFLPENRVDYNDKYGDINRTLFHMGRMYIFKYLKCGFVTVRGNVITSSDESTKILGLTNSLLPVKMEYFVWEGGIGNEIDGVVRDGNDIYFVSPNSGVLARIGYSGTEPISKQRDLDSFTRDVLSKAAKSNARVHLGYNRTMANVVLAIDPYKNTYFNDKVYQSNVSVIPVAENGLWSIVSTPLNGSIELDQTNGSIKYTPNTGYFGIDSFSYRKGNGIIRNVYVNTTAQ